MRDYLSSYRARRGLGDAGVKGRDRFVNLSRQPLFINIRDIFSVGISFLTADVFLNPTISSRTVFSFVVRDIDTSDLEFVDDPRVLV